MTRPQRLRVWASVAVFVAALASGLAWLLQPVCVVIPDHELTDFVPPIEAHSETNLIGQRYFQKRGPDWYHCKTRVERALFF